MHRVSSEKTPDFGLLPIIRHPLGVFIPLVQKGASHEQRETLVLQSCSVGNFPLGSGTHCIWGSPTALTLTQRRIPRRHGRGALLFPIAAGQGSATSDLFADPNLIYFVFGLWPFFLLTKRLSYRILFFQYILYHFSFLWETQETLLSGSIKYRLDTPIKKCS